MLWAEHFRPCTVVISYSVCMPRGFLFFCRLSVADLEDGGLLTLQRETNLKSTMI